MGFQHILPTILQSADPSVIDNIQSGLTTIAGSSAIQTQAITSVVLTKALLIFSYDSDEPNDDPDANFIKGLIDTTTQLEFTRSAAGSNDIRIRWFVIEFKASSSVTIVRGEYDSGFTSSHDVTISAVTIPFSVPFISWSNSGTEPSDDDFLLVKFKSSTAITLEVPSGVTTSAKVAWQVISNPDWFVYEYVYNTDATTVLHRKLITAVTMAETFLQASHRCGSAGDLPNGEELPIYYLDDITHIETRRSNPTFDWRVCAYVITGGGQFSIQRGNELFSGLSETEAITSINLNKSFVKNNGILGAWLNNNDSTNDFGERIAGRLDIDSATQLSFNRSDNTDDAFISWESIEFI